MSVYVRYVDLDGCTNRCLLPERPNGFAIFFFADHGIDRELPLNRCEPLLKCLLKAGYTVFTSSLYGAHWGSKRAVLHTKRLLHMFLKQETVNRRIFLLAEGAGALVAKQLLYESGIELRAVALLNPTLSLKSYFEQEVMNDIDRKRYERALSVAHGVALPITMAWLKKQDNLYHQKGLLAPVRIFRRLVNKTQTLAPLPESEQVDVHFLPTAISSEALAKQLVVFFKQFQ
ncbi:hypothetical protein [Shouchella lonarensis]|uniref:Serine aminopeptidase, S33 n=1 Tax=Shouchella lonarensis TaxID=1464122 RepID=A0A1G6GKZ0_9BACI|nr:hypothetical protein [Shouchella lonarensis]SDB82513.1 hypothetical protein SAMN05421737_101191 [Shouchella lonarensis]